MTTRIEQLRGAFATVEVEAALVANPLNLRYLTGFSGDVGMLVVTDAKAILAVDPRYTEQARAEVSGAEVVETRQRWGEWLTDAVTGLGPGTLAIEADYVTVMQFEDWRSRLAGVTLKPLTGTVSALRMPKSDDEIETIERATALTDEALTAFREWLRPGVTEVEAAWFIESYLRTHGAELVAFEPIVAAGANGAKAHARPSARPIREREPIVVDIGARISGYNSDLTRTLWIGEPEPKFEALYDLVLRAQLTAEGGIHAGIVGREADALARDVLTDAGYGDAFGHGLGHGVGLAIHEEPRLSRHSEETLRPGHVVTVEPGVYLPEWGGIRIEDLVVVTEDGIRILTESTKEPWIGS